MQRSPTIVYVIAIILAVGLVWGASISCGFTPDDYGFFHALSPIRTIGDVFATFWRHDPNPQYWRPLTNATYSLDFLLFGWDASGYHLTNIVLHTLAAILVFFFSKRFFDVSSYAALGIAGFFGVSASHDSNILWLSARTDILVTIMMMATLLVASKAVEAKSKRWQAVAMLCYFLALASKEIAIITLVLLPLLVWSNGVKELWPKKKQIVLWLFPYIVITLLFVLLRSNFTVPLDQMQPLQAEGSRSIIAFIRNTGYSLGYMLLPIDFKTASVLIGNYALYSYFVGGLLLGGFIGILIMFRNTKLFYSLYNPIILLIVAGLVSFQSFERWRLYFPSVGLLAIAAIIIVVLWDQNRKWLRLGLITVTVASFAFHTEQSLSSVRLWNAAADRFRGYEEDIKTILKNNPVRPIKLNLIATPTKLSSAPLIQLSSNFMAVKVEAEVQNDLLLKVGNLTKALESVELLTNLNLFALDERRGFEDLEIRKLSEKEYDIRSNDSTKLVMSPLVLQSNGIAARDRKFQEGEVYQTDGASIKIIKAFGAFATEVIVTIKDTAGLPIFFDGKNIKMLP